MSDEKLYQIALTKIPGLGGALIKNLISHTGSSSAVFKTKRGKLLKCPGIGPKVASEILDQKYLHIAEEELKKCENDHIEVLFYTEKGYPDNLKQAQDAPVLVYSKGNGSFINSRKVAIVGTRRATSYGKEITHEIVSQLAPHDPIIISGLAFGIDIEAHKAALKNQLKNISVLAHGLDTVYPSQHASIAKEIIEHGLLVSEYGSGVKPETYHFPARNRIIAGMADVVIVVEAAEKGGALITAEIANSYDREVFAVPGSLKMKYSTGCNFLIKQQLAHMYSSVSDLAEIMNWGIDSNVKNKTAPPVLNSDEKIVYKILSDHNEGVTLDELSWKSQISLNKLASVLLSMEFKGIIKSLPGKKYVITS